MHPVLAALFGARRHRDPPRRPRQPLWRLLLGELAWAAREALHPVKLGVAALAALGVGLVLGPTTPGPVLGAGPRLAVAVLLGFVGLAVAHRLLQHVEPDEAPRLTAVRVGLSALTLVVVGTVVVAQLLAAVTRSEVGPATDALQVALAVDGPLRATSAVLLAGLLAAALAHRTPVPGPLLFLAAGVVLGPGGLGVLEIGPAQAQAAGVVALVVILFEGGLGTTPRHVRLAGAPAVALATLGVAVTAGVTAAAASLALDVDARTAWLLGAVVASTDAAAVFPLLRRVRLPARLVAMLRLESGGNDPVAVLLAVGLLAAWDAPATAGAWLAFGAAQVVGGLLVGFAAGRVGVLLLERVELGAGGLYPVLALAVGLGAYGAAGAVGGSGFLATYVAGVVVAAGATRRRTQVRGFVDALSSGVEVVLFLLLGVLVVPGDLLAVAPGALLVTAALVLVARPLATTLCLAWFGTRPAEVVAVSWLGLRGAAPVVLATLALTAGIPEAVLVFDVVFFVVLGSVLVQGTSAPALVRRLRFPEDARPAAGAPEVVPLDDVELDVVEVDVPDGAALLDGPLSRTPPPQDVLVTGVERDGRVLLPRGSTRVLPGDRLVVTTSDRVDGARRVEAWVRTGTDGPDRAGGPSGGVAG